VQLTRLFDDQTAGLGGKATTLYALLIAANLGAWGWAVAAFRGDVVLLGTALLAYGLGLRHAVDADHIAAIDNVTRKLMQEGKRPIGAGFFFALGHSSVVIVAATAIALTAGSVQARFPGLIQSGSVLGTAISASFLLAIAALNAAVLVGVYQLFRQTARGGDMGQQQLDALLGQRGFFARLFRRLFRLIARSWHMYPLGFLFGLGFDTASEIGLLGIAAAEAAKGLSVWSILVFPALFTAGMSLIDASNGVLMVGAYGWAFTDPVRKLTYNLTVTGISVVVAVAIGGIEAIGLVADKLGLAGGPWDIVTAAAGDIGVFGYMIVALFVLTWLVSLLVYRLKSPHKISA
jgi:nickel/cobalt transporter (NiCoT) family protein